MNFLPLINESVTKFIEYSPIVLGSDLNFIGKFIGWLISWSTVGLGVIMFTLVLRLIVLPFDIFSKVKTKKNAVKMEEMRGDLEKLQKQYAGNKELYNQKMLALQKKNGYSPFAGCLPMILSLVIFFIAIDAFRAYSAHAMAGEYNEIISAYNNSTRELTIDSDPNLYTEEDGGIGFNEVYLYRNIDKIYPEYASLVSAIKLVEGETADGQVADNAHYLTIILDEEDKFSASATEFLDKLMPSEVNKKNAVNTDLYDLNKGEDGLYKYGYKDLADDKKEGNRREFAAHLFALVTERYKEEKVITLVNEKVAEMYEGGEITRSSFLWVKNIWMPDVSYEHPIPDDVSTFKNKIAAALTKSCTCRAPDVKIEGYDAVTAGLTESKKTPNGYFIMVVLSIATMFLSQFIATRMQKSQLELQTVDGQAATTQKMMMWIMPLMFGVFAFSYSTAFSIYMTVSSVVTTVSSVLINLAVERRYGKAKAEEAAATPVRSMKEIRRIENEKKRIEAENERKEREKLEKKAAKEAERAARKKNKNK